ncbi:MARVEL domain-containing protein [Aspergillus foveolatus]|uniref:MARVEL domain-containing protein n=1 Tax=Aspergillus foveolatus TaxID=210207 RepID=UPI003CCCF558
MRIIDAILRVFQAISAIIVLGISVDLARGQDTRLQSVPPATRYAAFCGGFGTLVSSIGIISLFISSLEGLITFVLDALSGVAMLASGIAYAVLLRHTDCSNVYYSEATWRNELLSGGCVTVGNGIGCRYGGREEEGKLKSRCVSAKADTAFMFISFVACVGIVGYSFFARGKGKGVSYA